jgi:ankyrin repeat protein
LVWSSDYGEPWARPLVQSKTVRFWLASPNYKLDLNTDEGHLEVAQLFFGKSDVDVNLKDESLQSLFLYAADFDPHSHMPLKMCLQKQCNYFWDEVTLMLIQRTKDFNPRSGMPHKTSEIVQLFMVWVDIGVDAQDKYDRSPLWYATRNQQL